MLFSHIQTTKQKRDFVIFFISFKCLFFLRNCAHLCPYVGLLLSDDGNKDFNVKIVFSHHILTPFRRKNVFVAAEPSSQWWNIYDTEPLKTTKPSEIFYTYTVVVDLIFCLLWRFSLDDLSAGLQLSLFVKRFLWCVSVILLFVTEETEREVNVWDELDNIFIHLNCANTVRCKYLHLEINVTENANNIKMTTLCSSETQVFSDRNVLELRNFNLASNKKTNSPTLYISAVFRGLKHFASELKFTSEH